MFKLIHSPLRRAVTMYFKNSVCFSISATLSPFFTRAPVGHTRTHFPQDVQLSDDPHGWFRSAIISQSMPRPAISHTWAPSTSWHTRTHRVQSTQRLRSMMKLSCEASIFLRVQVRHPHIQQPHVVRQILEFAMVVHHADRALVVALGGEESDDHSPVSLQAFRIGANHHALRRAGGAGRREFCPIPPPPQGRAGRRRRQKGRPGGTAWGVRCCSDVRSAGAFRRPSRSTVRR